MSGSALSKAASKAKNVITANAPDSSADSSADLRRSEPALFVVATPIGNLEDMVPRAVTVLQQVDLIAAEDTRHSGILLRHFNITTPMLAYHEHGSQKQVDNIITRLEAGQQVALISDAGTPLISDPGYRIVKEVVDRGIRVIPVPGASAMVAALSCAGLPSDRFVFEGFLPAKDGPLRKRLQSLLAESRTQVFYEAPHRVLNTVTVMAEIFGDERECVVARELTKLYETIYRAKLGDLQQWLAQDSNQQRGEIVLVLAGAPKSDGDLTQQALDVLTVLAAELSPNQAAAMAAKITGVKRKLLYNYLLAQKTE